MEYSLTSQNGLHESTTYVLILILMEYSLTSKQRMASKPPKSLNPYSNGILSDQYILLVVATVVLS